MTAEGIACYEVEVDELLPNQNVPLNNLCEIDIQRCAKVSNLLYFERAEKDFSQLQSIHIESCDMLEALFYGDKHEICHVTFPNLENLELMHLPRFDAFVKGGVEDLEFPLLRNVKIHGFPNITRLVSSTERGRNSASHDNDCVLFPFSNNLRVSSECSIPSLQSLELEDIPKLEEIFDSSISVRTTHQALLNKLEILQVKNLPALKYLWNSSFNWFSPLNLSSLEIGECENLQNIFSWTSSGMSSCRLTFSRLYNLRVSGMTSLATLCDGVESIEFPKLDQMFIDNCPKLTSIACPPSSEDADRHSSNSIHLFCCPKVTFGRLGELTIGGYPLENLWCREILPSFFRRLEWLIVLGCDEIQILFSFSIAAFLENLKILRIFQCKKLKKVIGDEESVPNNPTLLFPSLVVVLIGDVPLLENFCNWKSDVELPLLADMHIHGSCPQMKYFTAGSLTTPNLSQLCVYSGAFYGEDLNQLGVNGIIRRQYQQLNPPQYIVQIIPRIYEFSSNNDNSPSSL